MKVCKSCPFKDSAEAYIYDQDAMEALDNGDDPACHTIVGADAIFHEAPFTPRHPCEGHRRWLNGEEGFKKPEVTK